MMTEYFQTTVYPVLLNSIYNGNNNILQGKALEDRSLELMYFAN